MLIALINTIVISYLTRRGSIRRRKEFGMAVLAGSGVSLVFFYVVRLHAELLKDCCIRSVAFRAVRGLVTVVNLTQVLLAVLGVLFILVLTFYR